MANPNGILRSFKVVYPYSLNISFEPISVEILGKDGSDFVGNAFLEPSGIIDLHFQIKGVKNRISFARVKVNNITYNNKSYGVNSALKLVEGENLVDLYIEPPLNWQKEIFNIYLIYQDGSVSTVEIKRK
jgi:hypothetical protein